MKDYNHSGQNIFPMTHRPLPDSFLTDLQQLQEAYLSHTDPIKQSGFFGGETRWRTEREIILQAVEADGDFLDIGCANGYLLQCLVEWAQERGITLNPFGVDQGAGLITLTRGRFPECENHFWTANAWDWTPLRKFDYVYTLADNVPESFTTDFLHRLLERCVTPGGLLIVGAYGSYSRNEPASNVADMLTDAGLPVIGEVTYGNLPITHIAWTRTEQ